MRKIIILILLIIEVQIFGQQTIKINKDTSTNYFFNVKYNFESMEKLLIHTKDVLADPSAFLEKDAAYQYAMPFYTYFGGSFPEEEWKAELKSYINKQDKKAEYQQAVENLKIKLGNYEQNIRPILASYLPKKNYVTVKSNIYFTAFAKYDAINIHNTIVANITHPLFKSNTSDAFLNLLTHELFHSGYSSCSPYYEDPILQKNILHLLKTLQNEGMATYVAMQTCIYYPAPDDSDYIILKDKDEVKKMRLKLNIFFSQIDTMATDKISREAGDVGRAYYIVGADMARTIEMQKGREILAETVARGPIYFYELYNSIVKKEDRIFLFDFSKYMSPLNDLQKALESDNDSIINKVRTYIVENKDSIPENEIGELLGVGTRFLRGKKQLDKAKFVFKLLSELNKESSWPYAYLGELEIARKNKELAKEYLLKSLELDNVNPLALRLMNSLN